MRYRWGGDGITPSVLLPPGAGHLPPTPGASAEEFAKDRYELAQALETWGNR
ncbi:hypothetical protein [Methanofollis ethanolicus]|uniref:hypothetical protein n=1 Tax=Methanofollis ethanolicus TaxID=488124 RepID=UPI001365B5F5|nr:hypothetical protein [Methanofollis ethanolicus]